ncbi:MAG: exported protein of unknown function [Proteobacteria bacterium]|nr:exported protein of unknown function [Pseudomonadota bacterium]
MPGHLHLLRLWLREVAGIMFLSLSTLTMPAAGEAAETGAPDETLGRLEAAVLAQPDQPHIMLDLAQALLQRARVSSNAADSARARALVQRALEKAPEDSRSWTLKAWDEMNRHRFSDALHSVRQAHSLSVPTAISLGLETDALVELGHYQEAIAVTQKLLDTFPGLPANSRAAHLRMLHGDLPGAIALLSESLGNTPVGSEAHAWALRQLAELYLDAGLLGNAEQALATAEQLFPAKVRDAALRARLREAQNQPAAALALLLEALEAYPSPDYAVAAWKLARQLGDRERMRRLELLLDGMARLDASGDQLFRRAFAEYALLRGRIGEAERLAREEFRVRPDVYSQALLAWVLRQSGQRREAARHAEAALRLGTRDARLRHWVQGGGPRWQLTDTRTRMLELESGGSSRHPKWRTQ